VLPALGAALGFLLSPIGLVIAAIAAVIAIGVAVWKNWDTIKAAAAAVWDFVVDKFNWAKDAIGGVFGWLGEQWENFKLGLQLLQDKVGEVWNWIQSKIAAVVGWIIGKWNDFKAGIQLLIDKFFQLRDRVADAIGGVWDLISGIPGKVKDIFSGAGQWLIDAGRNIIQGLIDGIMGMIGKIGDAVGGAAQRVRDFWPFSPAKRGPLSGTGSPKHAGRNIATMLGDGIRAGLPAVTAAADRLAASASVAGTGGFGMSTGVSASAMGATTAATGTGGGVVFAAGSIVVQGNIATERGFARDIEKAIAENLRRKGG
jgi:phage-related protein